MSLGESEDQVSCHFSSHPVLKTHCKDSQVQELDRSQFKAKISSQSLEPKSIVALIGGDAMCFVQNKWNIFIY